MDLGAEMEAGGQAGKGQSLLAGARPGRELSTNWLKPASGNLATGLASEAPSFRSSWQAQVNAWRGVSRGTNGVESQDASEAETADATSGALISRAANPGKISPSAQESNSSLPSSSLSSSGVVTKQNVSIPAASQKESWSDTGRSVAVETPVTQISVSRKHRRNCNRASGAGNSESRRLCSSAASPGKYCTGNECGSTTRCARH